MSSALASMGSSSKSSRDIRLDTLRGLMLVIIAVDHLPSNIRVVTDQTFGFISAAEGFVFLSGLVAGLVFTRRLARIGWSGIQGAARHRAGQLYVAQMVALGATFALLNLFAVLSGNISGTSPAMFFSGRGWAFLLGALFCYQPGLLDILPMYCLFMLALPWILRQLEMGRLALLFSVSAGLWLFSQLQPMMYLQQAIKPFAPVNFGSFDPFAWQFLFVVGVCFGRLFTMESWKPVFPRWAIGAAFTVGLVLMALRHGWLPSPFTSAQLGYLVGKRTLGPLRLFDFFLLVFLLGLLGRRFPRLLSWEPLAVLGRHSLTVFVTQTVLLLVLLSQDAMMRTQLGAWTGTAIAIAGGYVPALWFEYRRSRDSTRQATLARGG